MIKKRLKNLYLCGPQGVEAVGAKVDLEVETMGPYEISVVPDLVKGHMNVGGGHAYLGVTGSEVLSFLSAGFVSAAESLFCSVPFFSTVGLSDSMPFFLSPEA